MVLAAHLEQAGLRDVAVTSAGIGGWHAGEPMDPRARRTLADHGYPTAHTAAQVDASHLGADLLVAMDDGHRAALLRRVEDPERVRLMRSFDPAAGGDLDVPDPYYGDDEGFDEVLAMVEAASPGLLTWVRERTP